jgi:hypothetical protein
MNKGISGILVDMRFKATSFLCAETRREINSSSKAIGGFGGRGAGEKEKYEHSPDRFLTSEPARFCVSKKPPEITNIMFLIEFKN